MEKIDNEIDNYYVLKNRWEMNQSSENGQYCFNQYRES